MIHTVKGLSIVIDTEVDAFLELSCCFYDPTDVGNLIFDSSAFSKSSLYIWKFSIHVFLKPSLEDFEHYLACMWNLSVTTQMSPFYPFYLHPAPPSPLVTTNLFLIPMWFSFICSLIYFILHIWVKFIWYLSFFTWLISLSIMPSSSIPVVEDAIFHFLWLGRVPLCVCVCVYLPHLYPVIHWWTLSFISHILAIINNTQWKQRCIYFFKLVYFR